MRLFLLASFSCLWLPSLSAQDLYLPRDIRAAYKNETRSPDGRPGKNYWQNRGRYDITITALPPDRLVRGEESITYFNNSPDSIRTLIIKLLLNIHKPGAPRNAGATPGYLTSGIRVDAVTLNGDLYGWKENPRRFTWQPMALPKALAPRDSLSLTFRWHYEISKESNREGMIDSLTFFLAYFFPRVAVFDDYNGWDRMNFTDMHEFYNDFNDYVVTINVPSNYVVWGTGTLQHPEKVLQPDIVKRYLASFTSDEVIHVASKEELATRSVTRQNATNSWQFTAQNVPDVAFGFSDHYLWDAGSVVVDDVSKRRASVQAAYSSSAHDYRHMVKFGKHSVSWLSRQWPGIPYPYEKTTIFQGFAGQEYPMMANDESYQDTTFSRFVAAHEIAHTYMPFYMGTNETRYGFMDEGWATTLEFLISRDVMGAPSAERLYKEFRIQNWIGDRSSHEDIPIITPGDALTGVGFANNEYGKASLGYLAMKDLLGDELFKKCLHAYIDRWHGKHPAPWDFFYTFNNVSGKNLNWFWNSWFFMNNYIDLAIKEVKQTPTGYTVNLDNVGGMPVPFDVAVTFSDGTSSLFHQTPAAWQTDQKKVSISLKTKKKVQSLKIDGGIWMDADETNNEWTSK